MYPASDVELSYSVPSWISARAIVFISGPALHGQTGHRFSIGPGRPSSSCLQLADLGGKLLGSLVVSNLLIRPVFTLSYDFSLEKEAHVYAACGATLAGKERSPLMTAQVMGARLLASAIARTL